MRMLGLLFGLVLAAASAPAQAFLSAQPFLDEISADRNPVRRSEKSLTFATEAFDQAKQFYLAGEIKQGDRQLEQMTNVLKECVESLEESHRSRVYKKAEQKVAVLMKRMQGLMDQISYDDRGWMEYTNKKLQEIHDKLIDGVMSK